jgi:hypothetical protein
MGRMIPVGRIGYTLLVGWLVAMVALGIRDARCAARPRDYHPVVMVALVSTLFVAIGGRVGRDLALSLFAPPRCAQILIELFAPCNWIALLGLLVGGGVVVALLGAVARSR